MLEHFVRAVREEMAAAADRAPHLEVGTMATDPAISLSVTIPGRDVAMGNVPAAFGTSYLNEASQVIVLAGPTPVILGVSPYISS